jgi:hypothetical protein
VPDLDDVLDWVPEVDRDLAADREWVETDCDLVPARDLFAALGWARSLDAVRDLEPDFEVGAGLPAAFWLLRDFDVLLVGDFAMESLPFDAQGRMPAPRGAKASCGTMISGPFGFRRFHVTGLIAPLSRPERMELPGSFLCRSLRWIFRLSADCWEAAFIGAGRPRRSPETLPGSIHTASKTGTAVPPVG